MQGGHALAVRQVQAIFQVIHPDGAGRSQHPCGVGYICLITSCEAAGWIHYYIYRFVYLIPTMIHIKTFKCSFNIWLLLCFMNFT